MRRMNIEATAARGWVLAVLAGLWCALSYFASVNRYVAMFGSEMSGAYDCDGPFSAAIFLVPALLLSIIAVIVTARGLRRRRTRLTLGAFLLSGFVLVAAVVRLPVILAEHRKNIAIGSPCR